MYIKVCSIFSGLDFDLWGHVTQSELLRFMRTEHPDILDSIRDKKEITKETGDSLKKAVDKFAKAFA